MKIEYFKTKTVYGAFSAFKTAHYIAQITLMIDNSMRKMILNQTTLEQK